MGGCPRCGFIGSARAIYDPSFPCPACGRGGPVRNSDESRRELERVAQLGDRGAQVRLLVEEIRSGAVTANEVLARAARGDELAREALALDPAQVAILMAVGGFGKDAKTGAAAEAALRAFFRALGYTPDTRSRGSLVSAPDADGKIRKVSFSPRVMEEFTGRPGAWRRTRSVSKLEQANRLIAEAEGPLAEKGFMKKRVAAAEKTAVRATKRTRSKNVLRATAVLVSQELTPEERLRVTFESDVRLTLRAERMLPVVDAELAADATEEKIDAGLTANTPPVFFRVHERGDKDWPTSYEWTDALTGLPIEMKRRPGDNSVSIVIGSIPVNPVTGGVDSMRMGRALFGRDEDEERYVGLAGVLRRGMFTDSPVDPEVYMVASRDPDLTRRMFRSFCRIIHAYGFNEFVSSPTDRDEKAIFGQLLEDNELVVVGRGEGARIWFRCNAALAGAPDTADVPYEDPKQLKLFNRRRRNSSQTGDEEEVRLLINELEAARASSLRNMSLGMDFIRARPEWHKLTSPRYHDALVRVAKQRGGVGNMNEHAREFYAEAIIESSRRLEG